MFKMPTGFLAVFVAGSLGLACSDHSGLNPGGGTGGAGGAAKGGQTVGSGGTVGAGGVSLGGSIGVGGPGGTVGAGGAGSGGSGGLGGETGGCPFSTHSCAINCGGELPTETLPNPDPCGCPIYVCAPHPDAGVAKDGAGPDALPGCPPIACTAMACAVWVPNTDPCGCPVCASSPDADIAKDADRPDSSICPGPIPPCAPMICPKGYQMLPQPCGCPLCVSMDGGTAPDSGQADAPPICPLRPCPALACPWGFQPNPEPCGCPICYVPPDPGVTREAGGETATASCTGLDACTCLATSGCAPIAEPCWCPFPQCNSSAACICGGGRFVGCAPQASATCADAKAHLAALCPTLRGPTFDGLCTRPAPECVIKCLAEVSSCGDISCTLCEACDCIGDHFSTCYGQCVKALGD
jgi:hypothetical protein